MRSSVFIYIFVIYLFNPPPFLSPSLPPSLSLSVRCLFTLLHIKSFSLILDVCGVKYMQLRFKTQEMKTASPALGTRLFLPCVFICRCISVFAWISLLHLSTKKTNTCVQHFRTSSDCPLKKTNIHPSSSHFLALLLLESEPSFAPYPTCVERCHFARREAQVSVESRLEAEKWSKKKKKCKTTSGITVNKWRNGIT